MAVSTTIITIAPDSLGSLERDSHRRGKAPLEVRMGAGKVICIDSAPYQANARIEQPIGEIHAQVQKDDERRPDQYNALDHREIACHQGLEDQTAQARPREHRLSG